MLLENPGEQLRLYQATVMVLSGQPQKPVDVLFFHNRSYGDYTDLFEIAGEMFRRGRVRLIAVTNNEGERYGGTNPFEANPGKTWCIENLLTQGIPIESIIYPDTMTFHTRQENDAFLELSIQRSCRKGVILTQPHQLLRAMLGMLQAMKEVGYVMEIFTASPPSTPWQEVARGNQGTESKPRVDHIRDELERVCTYQASGELASFDNLFAYLEARDTGRLLVGPIGGERFKI